VATQQNVDKYNAYRYVVLALLLTQSVTAHDTKLQGFRGSSWPLHRCEPTTRQREPSMAWDAQEMYPRRQRLHDILFRPPMLIVLHHQDLVRFGSLREEDELGKVRCWDLHVFYVFQVRILHSLAFVDVFY